MDGEQLSEVKFGRRGLALERNLGCTTYCFGFAFNTGPNRLNDNTVGDGLHNRAEKDDQQIREKQPHYLHEVAWLRRLDVTWMSGSEAASTDTCSAIKRIRCAIT